MKKVLSKLSLNYCDERHLNNKLKFGGDVATITHSLRTLGPLVLKKTKLSSYQNVLSIKRPVIQFCIAVDYRGYDTEIPDFKRIDELLTGKKKFRLIEIIFKLHH